MTNGNLRPWAVGLLFWCGIVVSVASPALFGFWHQNATIAWMMILSGAFLVLVSRVDTLTSLSLGPLKGEMRQTINKANATIGQLQHLASTLSRILLSDVMASNFISGLPLSAKFEIFDDTIRQLKELGIPDDDVEKCKERWNRGVATIFVRTACVAIRQGDRPKESQASPTQTEKDASDELTYDPVHDSWSAPGPEKIRGVLSKHKIMNPTVDQLIEDYRTFLNTGEIRDRSVLQ
jgi:hypothetical protein